ncbi:MAG TPA: FkbM family methyltransferase [Candidatus Sulfotelmatobacter sp.]|nr:FkbM family methyltransferase [Candidatus Sulfotelmatobacter sp.]
MNPGLKEELRHLLPRSLRRHRILAGPLRGSAIVTSWHDYPAAILGRTERALLEWFDRNVKKGETWLDIGAHYGYTAIALCRLVENSGRVFAFEPMLNTAGCVSRTSYLNHLPQLTVIPMALGNCNDVAIDSLNVVKGMVDSTLKPTNEFKEHFLVSRLDWLWPKICGPDARIDGIKIDVQGMEIKVLEGMADVAKGCQPKLLVELHKGVSRPRFLEVISSIGYEARGVAVDPLPGESEPLYADDRSYQFTPSC